MNMSITKKVRKRVYELIVSAVFSASQSEVGCTPGGGSVSKVIKSLDFNAPAFTCVLVVPQLSRGFCRVACMR